MLNDHARNRIWLLDLAAINAEIDASGVPSPTRRARRNRARKLKPLWEE